MESLSVDNTVPPKMLIAEYAAPAVVDIRDAVT